VAAFYRNKINKLELTINDYEKTLYILYKIEQNLCDLEITNHSVNNKNMSDYTKSIKVCSFAFAIHFRIIMNHSYHRRKGKKRAYYRNTCLVKSLNT
jgi:hypothetical protein